MLAATAVHLAHHSRVSAAAADGKGPVGSSLPAVAAAAAAAPAVGVGDANLLPNSGVA